MNWLKIQNLETTIVDFSSRAQTTFEVSEDRKHAKEVWCSELVYYEKSEVRTDVFDANK